MARQIVTVSHDGSYRILDDTLLLIVRGTASTGGVKLVGSAFKTSPDNWRCLRHGLVDVGMARTADDAGDLLTVDGLTHDAPHSMPRVYPGGPMTVADQIRLCAHHWTHVAGAWRCGECPASSDLNPTLMVDIRT